MKEKKKRARKETRNDLAEEKGEMRRGWICSPWFSLVDVRCNSSNTMKWSTKKEQRETKT